MKTELGKILEKEKEDNSRRDFIKKTALGVGGVSLGGMMDARTEDTVAMATQNVRRSSAPSELRITDMRYAVVRHMGRGPIIRIDTNQGISGWGEVRDGGDERYALMLKSRLLGKNPCDVEMLLKEIWQFGYHGRQGGGVSAVDMALWDLAGKAYGVPVYQLLGGKYRNHVRLYADTANPRRPDWKERMKELIEDKGFTMLKFDFGLENINNRDAGIVNHKFWSNNNDPRTQYARTGNWGQYNTNRLNYMGYGRIQHPLTAVQVTEKGLDEIEEVVAAMREVVGPEIPMGGDHFGHFDINNHIRLGKRLDKYRLMWLEDTIPWWHIDELRTIKDSIETPICTGEDIFGLRGPGLGGISSFGFKELIDARCVDIIHPDPGTSGGLLETKRIGDYAEHAGIAMALHMAGTPICYAASVHLAAATENFIGCEHHSVWLPWWESMATPTGTNKLIDKGFAPVPDGPGLGIEVNLDVVRENLLPGTTFFAPTPEWDDIRSHDRLWS
jgi:L-alanine-DL-glutamate epimerase-like enolase superfamily enzyme